MLCFFGFLNSELRKVSHVMSPQWQLRYREAARPVTDCQDQFTFQLSTQVLSTPEVCFPVFSYHSNWSYFNQYIQSSSHNKKGWRSDNIKSYLQKRGKKKELLRNVFDKRHVNYHPLNSSASGQIYILGLSLTCRHKVPVGQEGKENNLQWSLNGSDSPHFLYNDGQLYWNW